MADPDEVLSSTEEKSNFIRLARLLISGGTALLREVFDIYCPPSDLPKKLKDPSTLKELKYSKLTKPQWEALYPSTGRYGTSEDFDMTLLFKLLRTGTICSLTPPCRGWDAELESGDYSLGADLVRIRDYRNTLYAHTKGTMDVTDDKFHSTWSTIRDTLVRIAGKLSSSKKNEWEGAINNFLTRPLTAEAERSVDELIMWHRQDMESKKFLEEGLETVQRTVREEHQLTRDKVEELTQLIRERFGLSDTAAQSSLVPYLRILLGALLGSGPQGAATGNEIDQPESQCNTAGEVTTNPVITGQAGENVGNSSSSGRDFMVIAAQRYLETVKPSTEEGFGAFINFLREVRRLVVNDIQFGSLIITVQCTSLEILLELWKDYGSGKLSEMAQKFLVTNDTLNASGLSEVKIKVSMDEDDFRNCEQYFLKQPESTLDVAYDTAEPESKRRKRDTPEHQSNRPSSESQDKQSTRSTEVSTEITRSPGRISEGKSTSTFSRRKGFPTGGKRRQPSIRSPRKQRSGGSTVSSNSKRGVSEALKQSHPSTSQAAAPDEIQAAHKRSRLDTAEDQTSSYSAEFDLKVVFALDYSKTVSKEDFKKEFSFSQVTSDYWQLPQESSKATVVVYGESADTIPIDLMKVPEQSESEYRRMDLALREAANHFRGRSRQHQLIVLTTAGKQFSGVKVSEDDQELLSSISEELCARNIKVIIVPVGWETDFKELGLIVKRPQSLFPLKSFDDMTHDTAEKIATAIKDTIDTEKFAKKTLLGFSDDSLNSGLWENISLCSDVMEGAWYLLYDDKKKPSRSETVKKFIRESIDSFHSTLVTESKMSISLAVFGNQGVGKSFFLNFLLNWGLPDEQRVKNGPLPSAVGGSQTPLPIYVKYGERVKVLLHKQKEDDSHEIWFPDANLEKKTLEDVRDLLKRKFQELNRKGESQESSVKAQRRVELQGPFPVFHELKDREMTSSGHLELEVVVELVDVPGYGAETGNDSISEELSKADVVLFFDSQSQLSGRPVSAEDIAAIFRKHDEFKFTGRPKLVHVFNDRRGPSSTFSSNVSNLLQEKRRDLSKAWDMFLESSAYEDEREKVPQLSGEALLEKLRDESEVVYFHPAEHFTHVIPSLKEVIKQHVEDVMMKQAVHPFLQKVHLAAKRLKTRIGQSITTEKRKNRAIAIKEENVIFQLQRDNEEAKHLVESFLTQTHLPLHSHIDGLYRFLYDNFMYSSETLLFLSTLLRSSLEAFTNLLIYTFRNANWSTSQEASSDLMEVVETLCESRVQQFCDNSAAAYLHHVLNKGRDRNPFSRKQKTNWSKARDEEKPELCQSFLYFLLDRTYECLEKKTGNRQHKKKSHFTLSEHLKQDVKDLLAVRSLNGDDASRSDVLKLLFKRLQSVIEFCHKTIREINPHPSLDIQKDISLPDKMVDKDENSTIPLQSSDEKIVREVKDLLKPGAKTAADAIRKLEAKLNLGKGGLKLPQSHNVDQRLWAKVLIYVLCDADHFNLKHDESFNLDLNDAGVSNLLSLARKHLFAYQKSHMTCKIMQEPSLSDCEIRLRKNEQERFCLDVLVSRKGSDKLDAIRADFKDPTQSLAPIFIPTVRPGPTREVLGNYFLEEDPWSKDQTINDGIEKEETVGDEVKKENSETNASSSVRNIFLVVEPHLLETLQNTIERRWHRTANKVSLMYVVLPQSGRGIGVSRAIIKSLAECFRFSLYWTVDDDIQFMYQFDENSRRWYKCSITRGLQFGQRVFQTCLEKTVKHVGDDERYELFVTAVSGWEQWAKQLRSRAMKLLIDDGEFAAVQRNPSLLHSPFADASVVCGGDPSKVQKIMDYERQFVAECRKRLFDGTINHIAGVSLAHESSRRYDYMSKYPKADYMRSEQRYKVVLHNAHALQGRNFVTDEVVFSDEEFHVHDEGKRSFSYWGIEGNDKSFCHSLTVSGVIGYQVIRIVHSRVKLSNVLNRVHRNTPEDEDEAGDIDMEGN